MKKIKNFGDFINESNNEKYAKTIAAVEKHGARKVAIAMVNKALGFVSASDLADTSIYANGLDTIEELLNDGSYESAYQEARNTAEAMLEDEGMGGLFGESAIHEGKEHKFADSVYRKIADDLSDLYNISDVFYNDILRMAISYWDKKKDAATVADFMSSQKAKLDKLIEAEKKKAEKAKIKDIKTTKGKDYEKDPLPDDDEDEDEEEDD
jgi:hypothetical protein